MARWVALALLTAAAAGAAGPVDEPAHRAALEHYRAGQGFMYAESWPQAEREFRAAIQLDPLLVLAHYALGQTCMSMKQYADAVKAFTATREAYLQVAALAATDQVKADQRRDEEVRELRDAVRLIQGPAGQKMQQPENAILKLESRIKELENVKQRGVGGILEVPAEFSLALGSAYFRSGALPDAQREYEAAVKVRPNFGEAHNNLAVVLMMQGRLEDAEQHLKKAEKLGFHVNPLFRSDLERRIKGS